MFLSNLEGMVHISLYFKFHLVWLDIRGYITKIHRESLANFFLGSYDRNSPFTQNFTNEIDFTLLTKNVELDKIHVLS